MENSELLLLISIIYFLAVWILLSLALRYRRFFGIRFSPRTVIFSILSGVFTGGGFVLLLAIGTALGGLSANAWTSQAIFPSSNTLISWGSYTILVLTHSAASAGLLWFFLNSETEDKKYLTRLTPLVGLTIYSVSALLLTDASIVQLVMLFIMPAIAFTFSYSIHFERISLTSRPLFRILILLSLLLSLAILPLLSGQSASHYSNPVAYTSSDLLYLWSRFFLFVVLITGIVSAIFIATTRELDHLRSYRNFRNRMEDLYLSGGFMVLNAFVELAARFLMNNEIAMGSSEQTNSLIVYVFYALGLIYALYSCVIIYLTHQFNRPIESFREALSKTATGDMNALMPVNRKDDVGELADTYNMMVFRLKNLQDDLAESERQAAWSEMARQVAHEIKNPLTPMKLSIQHLYQQVAYHQRPIEDVRNLVKRITSTLIEEIDSLSNIATDFSKFARPVTEEFRLLDINVLIESVLDLYSHDDRIDFHIDSDVHDLRIQAAHDELKRVLINLIKNAMEASGPGGLIFIRAYAHQHFAVIEVADNGKGMTEQVRTKVFVPNFSTKNSGTGLGLAISRKIIEAHKGRIHFASVVGLGTTFTVYLPLAQSGTDTGFS